MYRQWIIALILVARIYCKDYDQDIPDEYSDEDDSESGSQDSKYVAKLNNEKAKRVFNKTRNLTQESFEYNNLSRNTRRENNPVKTTQPPADKCKKYRYEDEEAESRSSATLINYPFSVSIQRKGAHYATGALVDKRWILTCAGEFYHTRESIKLLRARLGSVDCKKGGQVVPVKRVEIHPSYVFGEPNYDLALLRIAQPVDFTDFIRPIGLSKITTKVISAKFMTTYWARLIVRGRVLPTTAHERIKQNSMRVSTQRLIPETKCLETMQEKNISLDSSTLCLKPFVTHHSVCTPDAGAPVVAEDGLWGITSGWTSKDCSLINPSPTVFSRISSLTVRSWLDAQMINIA